jgi:hypothetical protein
VPEGSRQSVPGCIVKIRLCIFEGRVHMRTCQIVINCWGEVLVAMGFVERTKQAEAEAERTRLDLETRYSRWQHAVFMLNQIISRYIAENPDLRSRRSVGEEVRHVSDPFLRREKQLDRLVVMQRATGRTISLEAPPLSPRELHNIDT